MPSEDVIAAQAALIAALSTPKSASGDAGSMESHSIPDLIELLKYVTSVDTSTDAGSNTRRGLRISKLVPEGTV